MSMQLYTLNYKRGPHLPVLQMVCRPEMKSVAPAGSLKGLHLSWLGVTTASCEPVPNLSNPPNSCLNTEQSMPGSCMRKIRGLAPIDLHIVC